MHRRKFGLLLATSAATLGADFGWRQPARAAVTQSQADQLKTTLTPFGSERAGNADGTIPAWTGGCTEIPAGWSSPSLMPDLFASDQPVVTINSSNMAQYADRLPIAVQFMMQNLGFSIVVYPTHRSAAAPQWVYDNIYKNATATQSLPGGARMGFTGAFGGIPYPILSSDPAEAGAQVLQNHNFRWGGQHQIYRDQSYAMSGGQLTMVLQDEYAEVYPYYDQTLNAQTYGVIYSKGSFDPSAPPNAVGADIIAYGSSNSLVFPSSGWELLTGQGRVRRIPEIQYDVPDASLDGIPTYDEAYAFLGAEDDFDWNLVGKKEMYVPYNNNKVNFMEVSDFLPKFINPETVRWELHRVYVVEATLHPGKRNILPHRRFYVDEDTWTVLVTDEYDGAGNLWRSTNVFNCVRPDLPGTIMNSYCLYNYQSNSYCTSFTPDLGVPPSQRKADYATVPSASLFNPQDMAARASF
jgi:hypothetical protein